MMKNDTACLHTAIPCSACPRVPRIVDVRALTRRHTPTVVTAPIHCGHRSNEVTVDAVRGRGDGKREEGPVQSSLDRMTAWRGGGERGRDGRGREREERRGEGRGGEERGYIRGGRGGEISGEGRGGEGEEERNCSTSTSLYVAPSLHLPRVKKSVLFIISHMMRWTNQWRK